MKKKLMALALVAVIVFSATACGGAKVGEANARIGEDIIQTVDNYLDGYIDANTAKDTVRNDMDRIDEGDPSDAYTLYLSTCCLNVSLQLEDMAWDGSGDLDKLKEARNEIADIVGAKKRR